MAETRRPGNPDPQTLTLLQSSGILNPNVTLEKIMEVTATLAESSAQWSVVPPFHTPRLCLQIPRLGGYGGFV